MVYALVRITQNELKKTKQNKQTKKNQNIVAQPAFTCSNSSIETPEKTCEICSNGYNRVT